MLELAAYVDDVPDDLADAVVDDVPDDWEERWRTFHRGIEVGPLWIGPPWERPQQALTPVVIDPGRAFGTGAHATTRLCIEWLLQLEDGSLLDVGCGSGVLAIAAAKVGFAPVWAVDADPAAFEATRQNASVNGVAIAVERLDATRAVLPNVDVAVANIAAETVSAVAARVTARTFVTSGYNADAILSLSGFEHAGRRIAEGWAADLWQRPE